jgi:acetyl esterase/lipase
MMKKFLNQLDMSKILPLFLLIFSFSHSQDIPTPSWENVNYAGNNYEYNNMDIYLPDSNKSSYPVIITIYGSAWKSNRSKAGKYIKEKLIKPLLDTGFAVVSINHRSSSDAIFPAQIHDVKASVRFIRANADKYNLNQNFIGITGSSSGGHLSAIAGTTSYVDSMEGNVGNYVDYQSHVNAVVDWFGPTDFLIMDECGSKIVHNNINSPESLLIGNPIQDYPKLVIMANPITYISKKTPPFLIIHGMLDLTVPHCQSEVLHNALIENNLESNLILIEEGKHGPLVFTQKNIESMTDFFINELNK